MKVRISDLRTPVSLQSPQVQEGSLGSHIAGYDERFTARAKFTRKKGGESLESGAVSGKAVAEVVVRYHKDLKAVASDWVLVADDQQWRLTEPPIVTHTAPKYLVMQVEHYDG